MNLEKQLTLVLCQIGIQLKLLEKNQNLLPYLYIELITDHVWSENRFRYGFKDVSQFHLMTTFYNTPFIDVKIDFNSWLPRNLKKHTQVKLVNHYLNKFKKI